jgi:hypothetical protein
MALSADNGTRRHPVIPEVDQPKPMICLSEVLRNFLEVFRPRFSHRQWK